MIKRRSFLGYFGISWLTACFPVVLAACAPTNSATQADAPVADDKSTAKKRQKVLQF